MFLTILGALLCIELFVPIALLLLGVCIGKDISGCLIYLAIVVGTVLGCLALLLK